LTVAGCVLLRHGSRHDIIWTRITGRSNRFLGILRSTNAWRSI